MRDPEDRKMDEHHAHTTLSAIEEFYNEGKYSDVQLRVGPKLFKSQRLLLAANSDFFDTMFNSNFEEARTTADQPITLHDMDVTAFEEILHFMYTGEVRVNDTNVLPLLFMNDFLALRRSAFVKERCFDFLFARTQAYKPIPNAIQIFSFAYLKGEKLLVDFLSAHICQHLYHYSNDEQLMKIDFESLQCLMKISKIYILPLSGSHDVILKMILNWINHDRQERRKHRCDLMRNVDFSNVSSNYVSMIMNMLENVADGVLDLPENTNSALEIGQTNGNNRLSATITFCVQNVKEMKINKDVYSSPSIISNLSWRLNVRRSDAYMLEVYLRCEGPRVKNQGWHCFAFAEFVMKSCKRTKKCISKSFSNDEKFFSLDNDPYSFGFPDFIRWSDLVDPKNGYIKDNTVTIYAHVNADIPFCPSEE